MTSTQLGLPRLKLSEAKTSMSGWLLATVFALAVAFVIPLVTYTSVAIPTAADALNMLVMIYAGVHLTAHVVSGSPMPGDLTGWLFAYVWMGMAPIAQSSTAIIPLTASDVSPTSTAGIVILGLFAYDVGRFFGLRVVRARDDDRPSTSFLVVNDARRTLLAIGSIPAAYYYLHSIGGVGVAFKTRNDYNQALLANGLATVNNQASSAIATAIGTVPCFIALLAMATYLRRTPRGQRAMGSWVLLFVLIGVNVLVNNPVSASRYWFGTILIALFFAVRPPKPATYRRMVAVALFAAVVLFPYSDYFRTSSEERATSSSQVGGSIFQVMSQKDYDAQAQLANTLSFVHSQGLQLGHQLLGSIAFWVPRAVWPTKPQDTGIVIAQYIGSPNPNLSSPLWAEAYIDFGVIGVILALAAVGFMVSRIDTIYREATLKAIPSWALIATPVVAGYMFIIWRGSLLQAVGRAVALALCLLWLRQRRRTVKPEDGLPQLAYPLRRPRGRVRRPVGR